MAKTKLSSPKLYTNRELSWLEFNERVLREGIRKDLPLLERLKFLAIVSSNLDEFFMIRVAGRMQQAASGRRVRDASGLSPTQQLARISEKTHAMAEQQTRGLAEVLQALAREGIELQRQNDWTAEERQFLGSYFTATILPVLTPVAVQELYPNPLLPGLQLQVGVVVAPAAPVPKPAPPAKPTRGGKKTQPVAPEVERILAIPVPAQLPRFINLPGRGLRLALIEEVIATFAGGLFPESRILANGVFRITRDAEMEIDSDESEDLLGTMERAMIERRRRAAVRLELSADPDARLKNFLVAWLKLQERDIYEIDGMLDAAALMELANRPGFDHLKNPEWPPQPARDLLGADDIYEALQAHDVLLMHPYESFTPVVELVEKAADDPNVLAIKQTLYRTSGDSPIIRALARAAQNGKQVTVLVELRARFDESRNVQWAKRLEDAGCLVIYGIAGYKTHGKALLIVRREESRLRRYVHLATGNYNDKTARLYSDIGLMTTHPEIAADVASFFNLLTGYSEAVGWLKLAIAPTDLRRRFEELIEREIQTGSKDEPGLIMAKTNSLEDAGLIRQLYKASRSGVRVRLNVRGICCLRPGIKGVSDNIEVLSIVDRYLEHARIFYFRNGGHEEIYLSSADWMTRNLDLRLELLFPVRDPGLKRRLIDTLQTYFADNVQAWRLKSDGRYEKVKTAGTPVRAQEKLYQDAVAAVRARDAAPVRFRPLTRPKE